MAEQVQTMKRANGKGNRNPDKMDRNIDPGIANDCKLSHVDKENKKQAY